MISKITNTMPIVENPLCVNESPSFTWVIIYQDGSTYQCRSLPGRFTWPQICSFTNHYFGHWHDFFNTFVFCDWNWSKNVSHKHFYPWASLCKQVCSPSLNYGLKSMILLTWTDLWTNCTTIILYLNMLQNFNLQPMLSAVNLFM